MGKIFEKRICKICNNEFEPHHQNQEYCQNPHPFKCFICGKEEFKDGRKLFHQGSKAVCKNPDCLKEKIKRSNLEKYGVEHHTKVKGFKVTPPKNEYFTCSGCGETLKKETPFQKNCKKEIIITKKCEYCNKDFTYIKLCGVVVKKIPKACSKKCSRLLAAKKSKETFLERYGVDNISKTKEFREFMRETTFFKTDEFKEKLKKINLDKYGVEFHTQAKEVKEKIKETCIEKYGATTFLKSENYKEKMRNMPLSDRAKKYKDLLRNKKSKTNLEYFKKGYPQIKHAEEYVDFQNYIKSISGEKTVYELAEYFNVDPRTIKRVAKKEKVTEHIKDFNKGSLNEEEFKSKLKSNNIEYIYRDRAQIKPLELDFFLPEYNIAIEISPTWTHNSSCDGNSLRTSKDYHYKKFKLCADKNIELITIFDWIDTDKVINFIKSKIKNKNNIYARKCEINFSLDLTKEHKAFLNENHILGAIHNTKNTRVFELLYNQELVCLGVILEKNENEIELKRLAFKDDFRVQGGASKIIKNIFKHYPSCDTIITLSDNDLGTGNVYSKIGFELIEENKGSIVWSNDKKNKYIKNLSLVKQGADRLLKNFPDYQPVGQGPDLPSNQEIVQSYGFLPVYDCGYRKWIYKRKL